MYVVTAHDTIGGLGVNTKLAFPALTALLALWMEKQRSLLKQDRFLTSSSALQRHRTEDHLKSPLSGRFGTANSGSEWGVRLRMADIIFRYQDPGYMADCFIYRQRDSLPG